jgi:filamentous hemagglutinin
LLIFASGSLRTDSTGVIAGSGVIGASQGSGVALVNKGTLHANAGSGTQLAVLVDFTNSGTVLADNGSIGIEGPAGLTNLSGGTLTGGTWIAQGPTAGLFNQIECGFNFNATIAVDAANIELIGRASDISTLPVGGGNASPLETQLQSIAATGTLQLLNNRGYTTANTLTDAGSLVLGGGTLTTGGLTVNGAGTLLGFGVVAGSIANQASVIADGGVLDIRSTVACTGEFAATSGSTLVLNGGTANTLVNQDRVRRVRPVAISGPISGGGSLVVGNNATIELGVATTENVRFSGSDATLSSTISPHMAGRWQVSRRATR